MFSALAGDASREDEDPGSSSMEGSNVIVSEGTVVADVLGEVLVVGWSVTTWVGGNVVGADVVGALDGMSVGTRLGWPVGIADGLAVGAMLVVGFIDGNDDGMDDGDSE
jgi:hypothetical protein